MAITIQIFAGVTTRSAATISEIFRDATFLYLVAPEGGYEIEIDAFLQIYLTPTEQRLIRLENNNVLNTEATALIPLEYRNSGYDMRLALYASSEERLVQRGRNP